MLFINELCWLQDIFPNQNLFDSNWLLLILLVKRTVWRIHKSCLNIASPLNSKIHIRWCNNVYQITIWFFFIYNRSPKDYFLIRNKNIATIDLEIGSKVIIYLIVCFISDKLIFWKVDWIIFEKLEAELADHGFLKH